MVVYEAAHAIVNLKRTTSRELAPAISVLQVFCGSPKPTLRFAAVRTLNQVAISHPAAVTACNLDLENMITDSNRSIATLAITTLLKTGKVNQEKWSVPLSLKSCHYNNLGEHLSKEKICVLFFSFFIKISY